MKSKRLCALVLIALLSSCSVNNQPTVPSNNSNTSGNQNNNSNNNSSNNSNPINNNNSTTNNPVTNTPNKEFKSFTLSAEQINQLSESSIVKANNTLGLKLFADVIKEQKNKNVFLSPSSIALALQMTYNGADKETKAEMEKTLELNNLTLEEVNNLSNLLINKLNNPAPDVTLKVANSLWGGIGRIKFNEDFKSNLKKYYNASVDELDFGDPKTVDVINKWASDNTNGKIPEIIDEIPEDIVTYLMNAIYFKAEWTEKFKESDTQQREFLLADGQKKNVSMMSSFRDFRYYSNYRQYSNEDIKPEDRFEAAEVTYGKDKKVSLFLFLPDAQSSLEKFYSQLNNENLEKWIKGFYNTNGYISFPKFKTKWDKQLKDNFQNLGMKLAFGDEADFSKMTSAERVFISFIKHSSYIDVNEQGSEAAAVTIVAGGVGSSPPVPRFVADRPFFYIIRDNETKSNLFMGAVNNPEYQ